MSSLRERLRRTEHRLVRFLRSGTARTIGLVIGAVALAFFVAQLVRAGDRTWQLLRSYEPTELLLALVGYALFEAGAIASFHALGARPATRIWTNAQLVKYLPVPASAAIGMVGSSVRHGHSSRRSVTLMVRHALVLVGAATVTGAPAGGAWFSERFAMPPGWTVIGIAVIGAGIVVMSGWRSGAGADIRAGAAAITGWVGLTVLVGLALDLPVASAVLIGSAYPASWVVGQIVVPVPAGIGVREAAMIALLTPHIGTHEAIALALLTRLLHVATDGLLVLGVSVIFRLTSRADDVT